MTARLVIATKSPNFGSSPWRTTMHFLERFLKIKSLTFTEEKEKGTESRSFLEKTNSSFFSTPFSPSLLSATPNQH